MTRRCRVADAVAAVWIFVRCPFFVVYEFFQQVKKEIRRNQLASLQWNRRMHNCWTAE
jgi:hypothetical protein